VANIVVSWHDFSQIAVEQVLVFIFFKIAFEISTAAGYVWKEGKGLRIFKVIPSVCWFVLLIPVCERIFGANYLVYAPC